MPSKPLRRRREAMLDQLGEDAVFDLYIELGTMGRVAEELFEPHPDYPNAEDYGRRDIYHWLHAEEGRWERWQEAKNMRGEVDAEMAVEEAQDADESNVRSKKLKVDVYKWRAGLLNKSYSAKQNVDVTVSVEHQWLEAMQDEDETEQIEEADYQLVEDADDDAGDA